MKNIKTKNEKDKKDQYEFSVYLRLRPDSENSEYNKTLYDILKSYCTFESQSGLNFESYNGSDEGLELFGIDIKTFEEAKDIAIKCALFWDVGVVELSASNKEDNQMVYIKYSEPTMTGRSISDLPISNTTYHLNKYKDDFVIYKTIIFDLSGINSVNEFMKIKTKQISSDSSTPKEITQELSQIKPIVRYYKKSKQEGSGKYLFSEYYEKYQKYKNKYINMKNISLTD
jgi:hypothetical protein